MISNDLKTVYPVSLCCSGCSLQIILVLNCIPCFLFSLYSLPGNIAGYYITRAFPSGFAVFRQQPRNKTLETDWLALALSSFVGDQDSLLSG